jgi:hypothetical protein
MKLSEEANNPTAPATTRKLIGRVIVDSGKIVVHDICSSDQEDIEQISVDCLERMGVGMESEDRGVIINTEDGIFPVYAEFEGDVVPVRFVIELYDEDPTEEE